MIKQLTIDCLPCLKLFNRNQMKMNKLIVELNKSELCAISGGDILAGLIQKFGAWCHYAFDNYIKEVGKKMDNGTAWRMTD